MLPRLSNRFVGYGPFQLAWLTHQYEGVDDIAFLDVQAAVERLTPAEQEMYRHNYRALYNPAPSPSGAGEEDT